jgi:hypothetical protein
VTLASRTTSAIFVASIHRCRTSAALFGSGRAAKSPRATSAVIPWELGGISSMSPPAKRRPQRDVEIRYVLGEVAGGEPASFVADGSRHALTKLTLVEAVGVRRHTSKCHRQVGLKQSFPDCHRPPVRPEHAR